MDQCITESDLSQSQTNLLHKQAHKRLKTECLPSQHNTMRGSSLKFTEKKNSGQ